MRPTWQGWLLLAALATGVVWWVGGERERDAQVREAAARPACTVAATYWGWRADFDAGLPPGTTTIEGADLDAFVERARFTRDVIAAHATPEHAALAPLAAMVAVDAQRDAPNAAPIDAGFEAFVATCPSDARALLARMGN